MGASRLGPDEDGVELHRLAEGAGTPGHGSSVATYQSGARQAHKATHPHQTLAGNNQATMDVHRTVEAHQAQEKALVKAQKIQ